MYLTGSSLIEIKTKITGSNNINLIKVNVKPYGSDKMYMEKDLLHDNLYEKYNNSMKGKLDLQSLTQYS